MTPATHDDLLPPHGGRLCLVLLTGIGDVVHGLPLVNALRAARPDLEICWVAEPAPAEILRHHPAVDEIVVYRKKQGLKGILQLRHDLRRQGRFELVVNAQRYFKGLFPTVFAGAPVRLGLARDKTRDGVSFFNTHHLPNGPWQHTQDIFLSFLPPLGLERPETLEWRLTFSEAEEGSARGYFADHPDRRVGMVVGTANPRKDWPVEHYVRLVEAISKGFGRPIFLLGGPSDRERAAAGAILSSVPGTHRPVDALTGSVRELMWKIRGMDFIISPDTAPVHIARAMEIPVIGLYGHTNPARVGPYRAFGDLVVDRYTEPGRSPDPAGYAPRQDRMPLITPEDVLEKVSVLV